MSDFVLLVTAGIGTLVVIVASLYTALSGGNQDD